MTTREIVDAAKRLAESFEAIDAQRDRLTEMSSESDVQEIRSIASQLSSLVATIRGIEQSAIELREANERAMEAASTLSDEADEVIDNTEYAASELADEIEQEVIELIEWADNEGSLS